MSLRLSSTYPFNMLVVRKASKSVSGLSFHPSVGMFHIDPLTLARQTASRLTRHGPAVALQVGRWQHSTRGLATPSGQYDAVVIGGGTSARV